MALLKTLVEEVVLPQIQRAGLRYEVALSILTGSICWITNGPFPCGVANDWQIFKNGLLLQLDEGERVEADDGYAPGNPEFIKTPSSIYHHADQNVAL